MASNELNGWPQGDDGPRGMLLIVMTMRWFEEICSIRCRRVEFATEKNYKMIPMQLKCKRVLSLQAAC